MERILPKVLVDLIFQYTDIETCLLNGKYELCVETFDNANVVSQALQCGDIPFLEWVKKNKIDVLLTAWNKSILEALSQHGDLVGLEWGISFQSRFASVDFDALVSIAFRSGELRSVVWLKEKAVVDMSAYCIAASKGYLDCLRWLHDNQIPGCNAYIMDIAAQNGRLACVRYLHENCDKGCTVSAIDWAAEQRHFPCVKYLCENRTEGFEFALMYAARNGDLDCVRYLQQNFPNKDSKDAMHVATSYGRYDCMRYLYENNNFSMGFTKRLIDLAESHGQFNCMFWLADKAENDMYECMRLFTSWLDA